MGVRHLVPQCASALDALNADKTRTLMTNQPSLEDNTYFPAFPTNTFPNDLSVDFASKPNFRVDWLYRYEAL